MRGRAMIVTKLTLAALLCAALLADAGCGGGQSAEPTPTVSPSPVAGGAFEIYLISPAAEVNLTDTNCSKIGDINLPKEPIISSEDVVSYNWSRQYFELTYEACQNLSGELEKTGTWHNPFVVVANGERIYRGWFVNAFSSYWPACPSIWYLPPGGCNYSTGFTISAGLHENSDLRYDSRIYSALQQAGILIE
jgi:hypothetical protein